MLTAIKECNSGGEWGGGNCVDYHYLGLDRIKYDLEGIETRWMWHEKNIEWFFQEINLNFTLSRAIRQFSYPTDLF